MEKSINNILSACSLDGRPEHAPAQFKRRVEKAAEIIKAGSVFDGCVRSQSGDQLYKTPRRNLTTWTCTCADFTGRGGYDTQLVMGGYGRQCKHTLAQLICYFEQIQVRPYTPPKPLDRQTRRQQDPNYYKAIKNGEVFEYLFDEILTDFAQTLYENAQNVLKIGDCEMLVNGFVVDRTKEITIQEIELCNKHTFCRIFEIPELNGEDYGDFWQPFYEAALNGQLATLKNKLIDAINE